MKEHVISIFFLPGMSSEQRERDVGSGVSRGSYEEMTAVPYRWLTFPLATDVMASYENQLGYIGRH